MSRRTNLVGLRTPRRLCGGQAREDASYTPTLALLGRCGCIQSASASAEKVRTSRRKRLPRTRHQNLASGKDVVKRCGGSPAAWWPIADRTTRGLAHSSSTWVGPRTAATAWPTLSAKTSLSRLLELGLVEVGHVEYMDGGPLGRIAPVHHVAEPLDVVKERVTRAATQLGDWEHSCWVVATQHSAH